MKITWVVINCSSTIEANRIGKQLLKQRLIACYDIVLRSKSAYFWPPRSGKIETAKGAMVITVTLPKLVAKVRNTIIRVHSDTLPFIGSMGIDVLPAYARWVRREVQARV